MQPDWRPNNRYHLQNNIAFMDDACKGMITFAMLEAFGRSRRPFSQRTSHGPRRHKLPLDDVLAGWKTLLARTGTKPMRRAIPFTWLARISAVQRAGAVFGPEAINDRLLLIETFPLQQRLRTCWSR